ncbi:hypothetical protein MNBD_NITROSPIRAE01-2052 [hydrothermal vent metagenome]|uniref:Uncharacterized protein n=1 Tax=hydrothermal vent metagenome TaxID=652676 RepID=A0A3B1C9I9_9ZZZZ
MFSSKKVYIQRFFLLLVMVFISACSGSGGGAGGFAVIDPCSENPPSLSAANNTGTLHFYTGCGLWAVDPDKPSEPGLVEAAYLGGSLKRLIGGVWDTASKKVTQKKLHALMYAKADGRFYRISANKAVPITPIQVSSETEANRMCGVIATLEDYQDLNNSIYVYSMPGPDQDCGLSDDNIEKYIRLGMSAGTSPVTFPRAREIFTINDLVDKDTGALTGWLAIKQRRKQRQLPNFSSEADPTNDLLTTFYPLGFFDDTPLMVSGPAAVGGLNPDTVYRYNVNPPDDVIFPCPGGDNDVLRFPPVNNPSKFEIKLQKQVKMICLDDGTILERDLDASDADMESLRTEIAGRQVVKTTIESRTVDITASGEVTVNAVTSYADLYRCNMDLSDCTLLKETKFQTFCAESGFDQVANTGQTLANPFSVTAYNYDRFGENKLDGEVIHWIRANDPDGGIILPHFFETDTTTGDDGPGRVAFTGTLGSDDQVSGWDLFKAKVAGIGSAIVFETVRATPAPEDRTAPYCKRREEFLIAGIFPQSPRGFKNQFTGKMVVRIDLNYKPQPNDADRDLANKTGVKGLMFVYDTETQTLSASEKYASEIDEFSDGSRSSFPQGMPFISDHNNFYFADNGSLFRLPLEGGGNALELVHEGKQVVEMKLTENKLVYSLTVTGASSAITSMHSINKTGGSRATLLPDTTRAVLPIITDEDWNYVYFQTLEHRESPPGVFSRLHSPKEDGSEPNVSNNAHLAGRTKTKILGISGCADDGTYTCAGRGTLGSADGKTAGNAIVLGPVPNDITTFFFEGFADEVIGEGVGESNVDNVEIFHIRSGVTNSLTRTTSTSLVPEELL